MQKIIVTIAALLVALFASVSVFGQAEKSFLKRFEFDLSVGAVRSNTFTSIHTNGQNGSSYLSTLGGGLNSKYRCDIGYVVTPSITVGSYFAYSNIQVNQFDTIGNSGFLNLSYGKHSFFYGLSVKYQLLPLIFKTDKLRFQLYATTQLGLVSSHYYEYPDFYTKQRIQNPIFMEYGIGLGLGYKFSKHWGIFAEYNYGHFFNDNSSHLRGGLMVRL